MEAASAVAGLVSLTVLIFDKTSDICAIIQEFRDVPSRFAQELDWLSEIRSVMINIERTSFQIEQVEVGVKTNILHEILRKCQLAIDLLKGQIEGKIQKINCRGPKKLIAIVSTVFNSDKFKQLKDDIDRCLRDLSICNQEVSGQLSLQQYRLTMGTNEAVQQILAVLTANHSIQPQKEPGGEADFMRADQILFIKPREVILDDPLPRNYSRISPLTKACDLASDSVVTFLLDQNYIVDASCGRYNSTDLTSLMTSRSIPIENQSRRLDTMRILLDAGSRLNRGDKKMPSFRGWLLSWMDCPYDLGEGMAVYQAHAERSGALDLRELIGTGTLLEPLWDALYTYVGPLNIRRWTTELAQVALRFHLRFGTNLENGVLYFDRPLKHHISFDHKSDRPLKHHIPFDRNPIVTSSGYSSPQAGRRWYDQIRSDMTFVWFKAWFDTLILYDTRSKPVDDEQSTPCLEKYVEPTIQAFIGGHVHPWLYALNDAGIDVSEVVERTFQMMTGADAVFIVDRIKRNHAQIMNPRFPRPFLLPSYSQYIQTAEDLKNVAIWVFQQHGFDLGREPWYKVGTRTLVICGSVCASIISILVYRFL